MRPRAEPGLGSVVPRQGASPQQVGKGAGKDVPLRCLQRQQGRPPLAPARKKRTGTQLHLRGPPLRKSNTPTSPTRRRPDPRPHAHHPHRVPTAKPTCSRRESPPELRPITTTTTHHLDPSPVRGNPKEQRQTTWPTGAPADPTGGLCHPRAAPRDRPTGLEGPSKGQRSRQSPPRSARP